MTRWIPSDFPRESIGSVPGAQPKLLVRKHGQRYVSDLPREVVALRHALCSDLAAQLIPYARRKRLAASPLAIGNLQERLAIALLAKRWGLTRAEAEWIAQKVCAELRG